MLARRLGHARRARRDRGAVLLGKSIGISLSSASLTTSSLSLCFAFNRDWRATDSWFCDELVAAGLEQAEVVRRLAPCVNRLDVRDLYLLVSATAPVNS